MSGNKNAERYGGTRLLEIIGVFKAEPYQENKINNQEAARWLQE